MERANNMSRAIKKCAIEGFYYSVSLGKHIIRYYHDEQEADKQVNIINAAIDEEIVRATAEKDKPDPNTESLLHECCAALGWSGGTREQVLQVLRTTRHLVFDRVTWGLNGEYENFKKVLTMLDNLIRERK